MDDPMAAGATEEMPMGNEAEQASIFLTQSALGGRKVKMGDSLTLIVRDVDPETGDVQADLAEGGMTGTETPGGYEEDFEAAVPEEGMV
jgi:hypothetical protein